LPKTTLIVATDIDGTLTDKNRKISLRAVELLRELQKLGAVVILISSHAFPAVSTLADYLGIEFMVAETGVCGGRPWRPIYVKPVQAREEVVRMVVERGFIPTESNNFRLGDISLYPPKNMGIDEALELLRDILKCYDLDFTYSGFAIHVFPRGVNKGWGLKTLLKYIEVEGEILALGDGENDIPLFEVADLSITSIHSPEKLRSAADIVLPYSNISTTLYVLEFIEKLLRLRGGISLRDIKRILVS